MALPTLATGGRPQKNRRPTRFSTVLRPFGRTIPAVCPSFDAGTVVLLGGVLWCQRARDREPVAQLRGDDLVATAGQVQVVAE